MTVNDYLREARARIVCARKQALANRADATHGLVDGRFSPLVTWAGKAALLDALLTQIDHLMYVEKTDA